jgi:hypothetical protein
MRGTGCEAVVLHRKVPCNEADAVRSACLNGKKMAIIMKLNTNKNLSVVIFYKKHVCPRKQNKK